jgi:hypothetical protein
VIAVAIEQCKDLEFDRHVRDDGDYVQRNQDLSGRRRRIENRPVPYQRVVQIGSSFGIDRERIVEYCADVPDPTMGAEAARNRDTSTTFDDVAIFCIRGRIA